MRAVIYSSVRSLAQALDITETEATELKKIVRTKMQRDEKREAINRITRGHGWERAESVKDREASYSCDSGGFDNHSFDYVNAGDSYITTIIRYNGLYRVGCVADIIEKHPNRFY